MARKPTAQDVADLAGVSRSAVSLVLNGRAEGIVAADKQALILQAAQQLRYRPDPVALSLRTRRTSTLALVADLGDVRLAPTLAGVVAAATRGEHAVVVLDTGENPYELADRWPVDGLIVVAPTLEPVLPATERPTAVVGGAARHDRARFVPDIVGGAGSGAEHLLALGHRRLAMLGSDGPPAVEHWRTGVDAALHSAGSEPIRQQADDCVAGGWAATLDLLAAHPEVTAIACASDRIAVGACLAAAARGLSVPRELSVLGFDEDPGVAAGLAPALTTVRLPRRELGERATEAVLHALRSRTDLPNGTTVLEADLVVRASTAPV